MLTIALEHRQEELEKLAKKNREEHYDKEARAMDADVETIKHHILPQVRHQQELPLVTAAEVRDGIAKSLHALVQSHVVVRGEGDKLDRSVNRAVDELSGKIASRVEAYAERVAIDAYNAGVAARESDPQSIAKRALSTLYE